MISTAAPSGVERARAETWAWWCLHVERLRVAQQGPQERHWVAFRLRQMCAMRRDVSSSVWLDYSEKGAWGQVRSLQVVSWGAEPSSQRSPIRTSSTEMGLTSGTDTEKPSGLISCLTQAR